MSNKKYHTPFYDKNREEILAKKKKYYLKNKDKIIERQNLRRHGTGKNEIVCAKIKKEKSLKEIVSVLRKNNKHYLWNKPVVNWDYTDWNEFNLIE